MNRFKALTSRVMQCGVKEVRRQETVEEGTRCFKYGKQGHKKWECPLKKESRKEEVAPPRAVWEKVKRHSGAKGLPPRGMAMCMEGWTTPREVVTFMECRGYDYKGTKTEKNRGQEGTVVQYMVWKLQRGMELERSRSKMWKGRKGEM